MSDSSSRKSTDWVLFKSTRMSEGTSLRKMKKLVFAASKKKMILDERMKRLIVSVKLPKSNSEHAMRKTKF